MSDEPIESRFGFGSPGGVAGCAVQAHESAGEKAHPFAGVGARYAQQRTEVERKTAYPLLKYGTEEARFEVERTDECPQSVESVVVAIVSLLQPAGKQKDGIAD